MSDSYLMGKRVPWIFWSLLLIGTVIVEAGVVPGRWEKIRAQPEGTQLVVTLQSGQEIHCVLQGLTEENLIVVDPVSGVRELPKLNVYRITSWERRDDGNLNGVIIGAAVGTFLGALSAGEVNAAGGNGAASIVSSAVLCGLLGYLWDRVHREPETLYAAP